MSPEEKKERSPEISGELTEEIIINPSKMLNTPGPILKKLGAMFFGAIKIEEGEVAKIRNAHEEGIPVFILPSHSMLDYLYFNYAFLKFMLPLVFFGNGVNMLLFKPVKDIISYLYQRLVGRIRIRLSEMELLRYGLKAGRACLLFLKRPKTLIQWGEDYKIQYLQELITIQEELNKPIILVPLLLVWEQEPEQYKKSFFSLFFGDPQAPGRIRKFVSFALNFRRAHVMVGRPMKIVEFLKTDEHMSIKETGKIESLAQKLKWTLHHEFQLVEKAIKGPVLKGARRICEEIFKDNSIQREIESIAVREGSDLKNYMKKAEKILKKMAADFTINYVEAVCFLLTPIWHKLYAGIDIQEESFQKIRDTARDAPIVFLPSHKSHVDYLMVSYLLYSRGLIPPHIAAGDNLSFWPMGHIFRHCGAFFIRRTIGQDVLYKFMLNAYIRKLLKEGYWTELFIEGGRSRTGKVLSPRYGLLSMFVDAFLSGATNDIKLVPVCLTYEKVIEEKSYSRELSGAEKKKESLLELLKAPKVFRTKYGKVYIEFGKIISLKEFCQEFYPEIKNREFPEDLVPRLGHTVMYRINQGSIVTTISLVSMALLTYPRRGISFSALLSRIGFIIYIIANRGGNFSSLIISSLLNEGLIAEDGSLFKVSGRILFFGGEKDLSPVEVIGESLKDLIAESLRLFYREKLITVREFDEETIISASEENRINLDIYKNNIVHYFVNEALLSASSLHLASFTEFTVSELREETKFLSRMFKYEFIYRAFESYDSIFKNTFAFFMDEHIFSLGDGERLFLTDGANEVLSFFSGIIFNFIESYWIFARSLISGEKKPQSEKELIRNAQRLGERLYLTGDVLFRESVSSVNFKNCLNFLIDQGLVDLKEGDKTDSFVLNTDTDKGDNYPIKEFFEHLESLHSSLRPRV